MTFATRTSEGGPCRCPICGKQSIVSATAELGDSVCPHCGSLMFPQFSSPNIESDDERRLASLGILVETDDQGEVMVAELAGPNINDNAMQLLAGLNGIPLIRVRNTSLSERGLRTLANLMTRSRIQVIDD